MNNKWYICLNRKSFQKKRNVGDSGHYSSTGMKNHRRGKEISSNLASHHRRRVQLFRKWKREDACGIFSSQSTGFSRWRPRSRLLLTHARFLTRAMSYKSRESLAATSKQRFFAVEAARGHWSIYAISSIARTRKGKHREFSHFSHANWWRRTFRSHNRVIRSDRLLESLRGYLTQIRTAGNAHLAAGINLRDLYCADNDDDDIRLA